ncbi:MAG: hypothetical protein WB791_04075 [Waddliaceae bacterium]
MSDLTDEQLLSFDSMGLIPGPKEDAGIFLKRAHYCLQLHAEFENIVDEKFSFSINETVNRQYLKKPLERTHQLYGIKPRWIPLFFSNYRLTPWHGGCAWIFQQTEDSPIGAFLQLRRAFKQQSRYLSIYHRDELAAHELSHVGRMAFQEPRFEEFFACCTSNFSFRRWFGPIIQSSWESVLFVLILLLVFLVDVSLISIGLERWYWTAMWMKAIPLAMAIFACGRLWWRQRQFSLCLHNLSTIVSDNNRATAVLYRLTDAEIIAFSRMTAEEIKKAIEKKDSLRWRLIVKAYFPAHFLTSNLG